MDGTMETIDGRETGSTVAANYPTPYASPQPANPAQVTDPRALVSQLEKMLGEMHAEGINGWPHTVSEAISALSVAPATADGWRLVPRMAEAGKAKLLDLGYTDVEFTDAQKVFEAMIAAAPTATGGR